MGGLVGETTVGPGDLGSKKERDPFAYPEQTHMARGVSGKKALGGGGHLREHLTARLSDQSDHLLPHSSPQQRGLLQAPLPHP